MSILFLQSPYSFLFNEVRIKLKNQGIKSYAMTFNRGDKYLYKDAEQIDINKEINTIKQIQINNDKLNEILNIDNYYTKKKEKILNEELTKREKNYFYKYVEILEKIIKEKDIKFLVMQNDTRWQHSLAIYVANKMNINYYVFELGLFRPNTITIDPEGVNYNNSLPRNKEFYRDISIENKFDYSKTNSDINEFERNIIVAKYMIYYRIGEILGKNSLENKTISLKDYFSRFYNTYLKKSKKEDNSIQLPTNYIFVPFQVVNDSQTLVHSDFNNMIEFAETVIEGVKEYNKNNDDGLSLVFKEHPMDVGKVNYDDFYEKYKNNDSIIFLKQGDTKKIIEKSDLVITINSTVGIEALEMHKKVICLGRAFYAIEDIAKKSNQTTLANDIEESLNKEIDTDLIDNFLDYLKYEYQVEGNEYYYNEKQIKKITDMILEKYLN
jgi:capsule polysaccharide modification protein KpsS